MMSLIRVTKPIQLYVTILCMGKEIWEGSVYVEEKEKRFTTCCIS